MLGGAEGSLSLVMPPTKGVTWHKINNIYFLFIFYFLKLLLLLISCDTRQGVLKKNNNT